MSELTAAIYDVDPAMLQVAHEEFAFPTLSEERARELADEMVIESSHDDYLMMLLAELVLGLAPARPADVTDNANRSDAAHHFVSQLFRNTVVFDKCVRAFMSSVAAPKGEAEHDTDGGIKQ